MNFSRALAADRAGDIQSAADYYEEILLSGNVSLPVLLNLAILYWQATDPGLAAAKRLGPEFLAKAGRRLPELLDDAEQQFPKSTEIRFWKRYIAWADLGEALEKEYCRELFREDPETLVPALYLFDPAQGDEARAEALELLRQCKEDGTTRAQYIVSVLEGVMRRSDSRNRSR